MHPARQDNRMEAKLVQVEHLSFKYRDNVVFKDISFTVNRGEYIALLGANGSGKSTVFSCINGLLSVPPRTITVFDRESAALDPAVFNDCERIRQIIGTVLQNPDDSIIETTVADDVAFGPLNLKCNDEEVRRRVQKSLEAVNLAGFDKRLVQQLSGGERQRLALAGVLALETECLMADEVLSMIDTAGRASLLDVFDSLNRNGTTILHATHALDEAQRAHKCIVLYEGTVAFEGSPSQLMERTELELWGLKGKPPSIRKNKRNKKKKGKSSFYTVQCDHVSYCYPGTNRGVHAVDINIPAGVSVALTGPSGSGKTTLLQLINALLLPSSGTVTVMGHATTDNRVPLSVIRRAATLAIQQPERALFERYVGDDVAFGPRNYGIRGKKLYRTVQTALKTVGLSVDYIDRDTAALSGGEKRKVALAGVVALESALVLLDEPTATLDGRSCAALMHLIQTCCAAGKTVIVSTHDRALAEQCDIVVTLAGTSGAEHHIPEDRSSQPTVKRVKNSKVRTKTGLEWFQRRTFSMGNGGDSLLHRLPAGKKLLLTLIVSLVSIGAPNPLIPLTIALTVLVSGTLLGKIPFYTLVKPLITASPYFVLLTLIQTCFSWHEDSQTVLFSVAFISVTEAELARSFSLIARFCALATTLSLYGMLSSMHETLKAVQYAMKPLARIGVPVQDLSLGLGIMFRFIPLLIEEAHVIVCAQYARGLNKNRVRTALSLIIPLFVRALERSVRLSDALVLRLYASGRRESNPRHKLGKLG
ncbi:energy-coupling factor transport system permease/ATP-binding protein [Pillotina sp. SPG140]